MGWISPDSRDRNFTAEPFSSNGGRWSWIQRLQIDKGASGGRPAGDGPDTAAPWLASPELEKNPLPSTQDETEHSKTQRSSLRTHPCVFLELGRGRDDPRRWCLDSRLGEIQTMQKRRLGLGWSDLDVKGELRGWFRSFIGHQGFDPCQNTWKPRSVAFWGESPARRWSGEEGKQGEETNTRGLVVSERKGAVPAVSQRG